MTKDTARDAHWNGDLLVPGKKTPDHSSRHLGKFPSRRFQSVLGNAILAGNRCGKQCGKVRGWDGIRTARQIQDRVQLPSLQQAFRQSRFRRFRIAVGGPQQGGYYRAPDPVRGSFVAYSESPPSRSKRPSLPVSTVREGTCPCIYDNPGTKSEDRLERNLHVTNYDDRRR